MSVEVAGEGEGLAAALAPLADDLPAALALVARPAGRAPAASAPPVAVDVRGAARARASAARHVRPPGETGWIGPPKDPVPRARSTNPRCSVPGR